MITNVNDFYNGGRNLEDIFGNKPLKKLVECLKNGDYTSFQENDYVIINKTIKLPTLDFNNTTYKDLVLKPNKLRIVGINFLNCHEEIENRVPNILFDFEDINFMAPYNSDFTNVGGPFETPLLKYINSDEFLKVFCEYLDIDIDDIYNVYRYYDNGNVELSCTCKEIKLFFPKAEEVYGSTDIATVAYKNNTLVWPLYQYLPISIIKKYDGERKWWWLNSSFKFNNQEFCYVCYNGGGGHGKSYYDDGVSLSFCLCSKNI